MHAGREAAQPAARRSGRPDRPGGLVTQRIGTRGPETPPTRDWRAPGLALGLQDSWPLGDLELSDRSPFTENLLTSSAFTLSRVQGPTGLIVENALLRALPLRLAGGF